MADNYIPWWVPADHPSRAEGAAPPPAPVDQQTMGMFESLRAHFKAEMKALEDRLTPAPPSSPERTMARVETVPAAVPIVSPLRVPPEETDLRPITDPA